MHSLTFPATLPDLTPWPRPRLRIPNLLQGLKRRVPARGCDASRLERRLRRTASRGGRIVLGTAGAPYEPLALGGAPLAALEPFAGLEIAVTTCSPEIVEQRRLLVKLDQRHAVTVDMLVATLDPASPDLRERLRAISDLAADGLTTRVVASPRGDGCGRAAEAGGRRFFAAARESRAWDVAVDSFSPAWQRIFARLRLEHGFPRALPGRG